MNTQIMRRESWAGVLVLGTLIPALSNAAPPVTTGLFVNLSAEDPANFTFGDPNQIALWKDAANDGNDGSFQDFGSGNAANQPLFTTTLMPNGQYMNVVDFSRGGNVTGSQSSTVNSDFLVSSANGSRGEAFTPGGDQLAYKLGGTEGPDGLSYFVVWHSDLQTNPAPTSSTSSNQARRGRQYLLRSASSDPNVGDQFGVVLAEDRLTDPPSIIGEGTVPNQWHFIRDAVRPHPIDPPPATDAPQRFTPEVDMTANWYISALTANLDGGNVIGRAVQSNGGTDTGNVVIGTTTFTLDTTTTFGDHAFTILGQQNGTTGSTNWSLDGQIAEVLIYNTTLGETDFNAIIDYLQDKYFEPVTNPGDYNADGKVDAADYVLWRKNPVGIVGDPAGQVTWRNYFDDAPAGAGSGLDGGSVPELSALILIANIAVFSLLGIRRRCVR